MCTKSIMAIEIAESARKDCDILNAENKKTAEFISTVINSINHQLEYDVLVNKKHGRIDDKTDIANHAIKIGLVHAIGKHIQWSTCDAISFAAEILEDCNLHGLAKELRDKI